MLHEMEISSYLFLLNQGADIYLILFLRYVISRKYYSALIRIKLVIIFTDVNDVFNKWIDV